MQITMFYLAVSGLLLGCLGASFTSQYAFRLGLIDSPNARSSHIKPTPKGGGIGILITFIVSSFVLKIPMSLWGVATALALISLLGDKVDISPKHRLPLQFIAASVALYPALISQNPGANLFHQTHIILYLFFSIFIVGTANYYNFMDGINGIAGVTGVIGFGLLGFYSFHSVPQTLPIGTLTICISFSCIGFLPFNMPKAKVFMGDVGSILLGFVFAWVVVRLSDSILSFICLAAFIFPFYADELTTTAVRLKAGESLTKPHRKHLYQLMANEMGIAHWKISIGYGVVQLLIGVSVLSLKPFGVVAVLPFLIICFAGFGLVSFLVRRKLSV